MNASPFLQFYKRPSSLTHGLAGLALASVLAVVFSGCSQPPAVASKTDAEIDQAQKKNGLTESRRQAQPGVGERGQKLRNRQGPFSTPAKAMFRAEQQIMFLKADQALRAFEILNSRYPESHREYMEMVIRANGLSLPELPDGQRYEFDPDTHQLMVVGIFEDHP